MKLGGGVQGRSSFSGIMNSSPTGISQEENKLSWSDWEPDLSRILELSKLRWGAKPWFSSSLSSGTTISKQDELRMTPSYWAANSRRANSLLGQTSSFAELPDEEILGELSSLPRNRGETFSSEETWVAEFHRIDSMIYWEREKKIEELAKSIITIRRKNQES